ncbi:MAG: hypothetical protein H6869_09315 [Rhodospirillales bacterium]|nr:hypothetical protein [Rhodospirillales bacterium]
MNDTLLDQQDAQPAPEQMMIPEKFRDLQTGELRADALLRSYTELERKLSTVPKPPASPDEYCVDCSHGLFEPDADINKRLFDQGFTLEQVQAVYDLAAEKFVPMVLELAQEFKADREVERLVAAFGGEEKWAEVSRQLLAFGKKNLPPEVLSSLSGSFEGVMALYRMMKGQEPGLSMQAQNNAASMDAPDLNSMMRDPRYWRDRDPAYVAKVTEGFQKMYGE